MSPNSKMGLLFRTLFRNPVEFVDRLGTVLEVKFERRARGSYCSNSLDADEISEALQREVPGFVPSILEDTALQEIEEQIGRKLRLLKDEGPFQIFHNGDQALARICFAICRATRPAVVLETGVAYGVTSAVLLKALNVNQVGTLFSIDLPPLGANGDKYVGALIPEELKGRWQLFRGPSKRVMPRLLPGLNQVDLFIHDSLHTYRNMKREFGQVWPLMKPGSVLIADDIEGNGAFKEFAEAARPTFSVVLAESGKKSLCGVIVK